MRKLVVVLSLVAIVFALCASAAQAAPNLVVNGNFEAGNTGFTSAYTYSPGQLWPTTAYDVAANPNGDNSNFASFGDHTSGTGMMMVVNGATTSGVTLWSETVPVAANTSYQFEAWIRPMSAPANSQPNPGILEFSINQVSLGTGTTSVSGQWSSFNASWDWWQQNRRYHDC